VFLLGCDSHNKVLLGTNLRLGLANECRDAFSRERQSHEFANRVHPQPLGLNKCETVGAMTICTTPIVRGRTQSPHTFETVY